MRLGYLYVHRLQLQSSPFAPLPLHSAGGGGSGGGLSVGVCLIAGGIVVAVSVSGVSVVSSVLASLRGWSHAVSRPCPLSVSGFCRLCVTLVGHAAAIAVATYLVSACFSLFVLPLGRPALRLATIGVSTLLLAGVSASSGNGGGHGGSVIFTAPALFLVWG